MLSFAPIAQQSPIPRSNGEKVDSVIGATVFSVRHIDLFRFICVLAMKNKEKVIINSRKCSASEQRNNCDNKGAHCY